MDCDMADVARCFRAMNDAIQFVGPIIEAGGGEPECAKCCGAETDGDLCERCSAIQVVIADVILWARRHP